jgi:hypothetical protein
VDVALDLERRLSGLVERLLETIPCTGWPSLNCELTVGIACTLCSVASSFLICELLPDLQRADVRVVAAALLIERDRRRRRREVSGRRVLDVDEDVGQLAGRTDDDFLVRGRASGAATGSTDRRPSG